MNVQRRLALGMVSLSALYSASGMALGLGDLQLQSALNQPLQAIIQLHDVQGLGPADIRVSLADAETFARVGIERPHSLTDLRFTPMLINQQLVIRVDSSRPVKEPYLNFLVQLKRANGSLLREYTLLLDPPLYAPTAVVTASNTQPQTPAARPQSAPPRAAAAPARAPVAKAAAPRAPALQPQPGAARYQTVAGDSLWTIAATTRASEHVSIQRQMDAIHGLNPQAFVNGDPSRLRAGQQLVLPVAEQMGVAAEQQQPGAEAPPAPADLPPVQLGDRLRIEDSPVQLANEDVEELQQRLSVVETRFHGLLEELELRDARIASLQADLETLRQAREALPAGAPAIVGGPDPGGMPSDAAPAGQLQQPVPGALESPTNPEQLNEPQASLIERWWPGLLALLAVLIGALLLRTRREPEPPAAPIAREPLPQPITVPGSRTVDPLEGVELYLTYGRLPEARLMLEKAIAVEPQRVDLRLRMLTVLAELGEAQRFAEQAILAREAGADQIQIDLVKARYPQLMQARHLDRVEPLEADFMYSEELGGALNLDSDELEQNWSLLDEMEGMGGRRKEALHQLEERFESNLQDFPEVGEIDEDDLRRFGKTDDQQRNS